MRLLDLFCGAGGAARGYQAAGFYVVGVDNKPQPNYCGNEFVQEDALAVLADGLWPAIVDVIHASPPCQSYSRALKHLAFPKPELLDPTRALLERTGLPWVMENVIGAPLPSQDTLDGRHGLELCGTQFDLRVGWHRLFESSVPLLAPVRSCRCDSLYLLNPHNQTGRDRIYDEFGRQDPEALWRRMRGTGWMTKHEAREAIPPSYTEFIGYQLAAQIGGRIKEAA